MKQLWLVAGLVVLLFSACADQKNAAPAQDHAQQQNAGVGLQTRDVRLGGNQLQTDLSRRETTNTTNTAAGQAQIGGQRQEGTGNISQTNVPEYIVDLMKQNNNHLADAISDRMDSLTSIGMGFGIAVTLAILIGGALMAGSILYFSRQNQKDLNAQNQVIEKQTDTLNNLPVHVGREVGTVINGKMEKAVGNLLAALPCQRAKAKKGGVGG